MWTRLPRAAISQDTAEPAERGFEHAEVPGRFGGSQKRERQFVRRSEGNSTHPVAVLRGNGNRHSSNARYALGTHRRFTRAPRAAGTLRGQRQGQSHDRSPSLSLGRARAGFQAPSAHSRNMPPPTPSPQLASTSFPRAQAVQTQRMPLNTSGQRAVNTQRRRESRHRTRPNRPPGPETRPAAPEASAGAERPCARASPARPNPGASGFVPGAERAPAAASSRATCRASCARCLVCKRRAIPVPTSQDSLLSGQHRAWLALTSHLLLAAP